MPAQIQSSSDLVIGQWESSTILRGLVDIYKDAMQDEAVVAVEAVTDMRLIEKAEGVHLDWVGRKLGLARPSTTDPAQDTRFGFDEAGVAFDQRPFFGDQENAAVFPLPDATYRRMLRARAIALLSDGTMAALIRSIHAIDPGAVVSDQRDMTIRVVTSSQRQLELADEIGALARNSGVNIRYVDPDRFGFDEAGDSFDQSPFTTE